MFEKFLTKGELARLERKRAKLSQEDMALCLQKPYYTYRGMERSKKMCSEPTELTPGEYCFVIRRRLGLSHRDCAEALGSERRRISAMEEDNKQTCLLLEFIMEKEKEYEAEADKRRMITHYPKVEA